MAEYYCTLDEVKAALRETTETDDALIEQAINAASRAIEQVTGHTYYATSATRYYRNASIYGQMLLLDADLLAVTTLTNGDAVVIGSTYYWLLPRNDPPYRGIQLKSTTFWNLSTADAEVSIAGSWGSASTPPANVRSACVLMAERLYRRRDAPFGIVGGSDVVAAVYIAKSDPDVKLLLEFEINRQGIW